MNTSVATISERDFAAALVDDGPAAAGRSNDAANVDSGPAKGGEQLLRRLFNPSWGKEAQPVPDTIFFKLPDEHRTHHPPPRR